jgi:hypothetical protein
MSHPKLAPWLFWIPALVFSPALVGCSSGTVDETKSSTGPTGNAASIVDARLIADVYTWTCDNTATGERYQGAFGQEATLEYAPGGIQALELPAPGDCVAGLDMFPDDAGPDAIDIPGLAFDPEWESDVDDGTLTRIATGFYYDDVYPDVRTCYSTDEIMAGGVTLVEAGSLTGAATPAPNAAPTVEFSSAGTSIEFGDELTMEWGTHLWEEVFVQVRREKSDAVWDSVTCNATGLDGFTVGAAVWDLMDERDQVDSNNIYVGFQSTGRDDITGNDVQVVTRAIAVAAVED